MHRGKNGEDLQRNGNNKADTTFQCTGKKEERRKKGTKLPPEGPADGLVEAKN